VKDAAGVIGGMLKGESEFNRQSVMDSLAVFQHAAQEFGGLFPEGTQEGSDALPSVWSDREGFDAALAEFGSAVDAAMAADPHDLEATKTAVGPVFKQCKACHKEYRADD
jgi:cytochrome c556